MNTHLSSQIILHFKGDEQAVVFSTRDLSFEERKQVLSRFIDILGEIDGLDLELDHPINFYCQNCAATRMRGERCNHEKVAA
jgi:hypothetical protein